MVYSATYTSFLEACSQVGCPVCRVEYDAVIHYLDGLLYEHVNDFGIRQRLHASLGFCTEHTSLAIDDLHGNALGLAIIYDDLLKVIINQLEQRKNILTQVEKCLACQQRDEVAQHTLSELAKHIQDADSSTALQKSDGLCVHHMKQALQHMRIPEKQNILISVQLKVMEGLRSELAEYIRKNDYRFANEPFGAERDSWRRAVGLVAGTKRPLGGKK
jgi:hypothetical protein